MAKLSDKEILDSALADWRKLAQALHARFDTHDIAAATRFVAAVGEAAAAAGRDPEIRLTPEWVEVKLTTRDNGWWVTDADVDLARQISAVAGDHDLTANPKAVMQVEMGIDTANPGGLGPFWSALLTGSTDHVIYDSVIDPDFRVPNIWFQDTEPHGAPRQRFHMDLWVAPEVAEERIAAAVAAGGRVVYDEEAPAFTVLADPDGNKACVCTCLGR
jgi:4a-hydroxytetrahydrobiopterin dehydratase